MPARSISRPRFRPPPRPRRPAPTEESIPWLSDSQVIQLATQETQPRRSMAVPWPSLKTVFLSGMVAASLALVGLSVASPWILDRLAGFLPAVLGAPVVETPAGRVYTVRRGDTLALIARRELGSAKRWSEIFAINSHLSDPTKIQVGAELRIPAAQ